MLATCFFYLFASLTILFASLVILFKNTMHGVFSLILTFLAAAGLFLMTGAEFLAMVLVVVYVGAVAVLFLFVVMMLGMDFNKPRKQSLFYFFLSAVVGLCFAGFFYLLLLNTQSLEEDLYLSNVLESTQGNTLALGEILYTTYFLPFQLTGLILLVAMIGAILLTLRSREDAKRQNVHLQTQKTGTESIRVISVPLRKGL